MSEYYLSHTGAQLDDAINKVRSGDYIDIADIISHCTQSANGSYTKTSDTTMNNISVTVGFRPKVFVLTNLGGVVSNSTSTAKNHLLTSLIVCDDEGNILLKFSSYLYYTSSGFMGSRSASAANTLAATENGVIGGSGTSVVARANVEYQWYAWG